MTNNKTAEEILQKHITMDWPMRLPFTGIHAAMTEFADVKTSELQSQLIAKDLLLKEAMEALNEIKADAPKYHDCIDNGLSKCNWCIASDALTKLNTKGI